MIPLGCYQFKYLTDRCQPTTPPTTTTTAGEPPYPDVQQSYTVAAAQPRDVTSSYDRRESESRIVPGAARANNAKHVILLARLLRSLSLSLFPQKTRHSSSAASRFVLLCYTTHPIEQNNANFSGKVGLLLSGFGDFGSFSFFAAGLPKSGVEEATSWRRRRLCRRCCYLVVHRRQVS